MFCLKHISLKIMSNREAVGKFLKTDHSKIQHTCNYEKDVSMMHKVYILFYHKKSLGFFFFLIPKQMLWKLSDTMAQK